MHRLTAPLLLVAGLLVGAAATGCGQRGYADCVLARVREGSGPAAVAAIEEACREKARRAATERELSGIEIRRFEDGYRAASVRGIAPEEHWSLTAIVASELELPLRQVDVELVFQERVDGRPGRHLMSAADSGWTQKVGNWSEKKRRVVRCSGYVEPYSNGNCGCPSFGAEVIILDSSIVSAVLYVP